MIQRIQTFYLFLISGLMIALLFLPLAVIQSGDVFYTFDVLGMSTMAATPELVYPMWALMALVAVISLIALITIFLYKKRIVQIRLCVFNSILLVGFYGLFAFFAWQISKHSDPFHFNIRIALAFPIISLILNYLSIRNIGADEVLVRSLDRLR